MKILFILLIIAIISSGCLYGDNEEIKSNELIEILNQKNENLNNLNQIINSMSDDIIELHETIEKLSQFAKSLNNPPCKCQ
jgi:PBP1b-binding outer membrane lipoprotein LpoB